MAKYVVTIEVDNDQSKDVQSELSRILHGLADDIFYNHPGWTRRTLCDVADNTVGQAKLIED